MINMSFSKIEVLSVLFGLLIVGFVAFSNNGGISVKSTPEHPSVIDWVKILHLLLKVGMALMELGELMGLNGANGADGD